MPPRDQDDEVDAELSDKADVDSELAIRPLVLRALGNSRDWSALG